MALNGGRCRDFGDDDEEELLPVVPQTAGGLTNAARTGAGSESAQGVAAEEGGDASEGESCAADDGTDNDADLLSYVAKAPAAKHHVLSSSAHVAVAAAQLEATERMRRTASAKGDAVAQGVSLASAQAVDDADHARDSAEWDAFQQRKARRRAAGGYFAA